MLVTVHSLMESRVQKAQTVAEDVCKWTRRRGGRQIRTGNKSKQHFNVSAEARLGRKSFFDVCTYPINHLAAQIDFASSSSYPPSF